MDNILRIGLDSLDDAQPLGELTNVMPAAFEHRPQGIIIFSIYSRWLSKKIIR